jgi:hypothetical protein
MIGGMPTGTSGRLRGVLRSVSLCFLFARSFARSTVAEGCGHLTLGRPIVTVVDLPLEDRAHARGLRTFVPYKSADARPWSTPVERDVKSLHKDSAASIVRFRGTRPGQRWRVIHDTGSVAALQHQCALPGQPGALRAVTPCSLFSRPLRRERIETASMCSARARMSLFLAATAIA